MEEKVDENGNQEVQPTPESLESLGKIVELCLESHIGLLNQDLLEAEEKGELSPEQDKLEVKRSIRQLERLKNLWQGLIAQPDSFSLRRSYFDSLKPESEAELTYILDSRKREETRLPVNPLKPAQQIRIQIRGIEEGIFPVTGAEILRELSFRESPEEVSAIKEEERYKQLRPHPHLSLMVTLNTAYYDNWCITKITNAPAGLPAIHSGYINFQQY